MNNNNRSQGDVVETDFRLARFSAGKVWSYNKWRFAPYLSLDYRWGQGDYVLVNDWYWEPRYAVSHYKSFGTGIGGSVNYLITRHITFGIESHFDYFFQKNKLTDGQNDYSAEPYYQPNKKALIAHFKIGFLF